MGRSLDGELRAKQLYLEQAMAELAALREQVAKAEQMISDSQFEREAPAKHWSHRRHRPGFPLP